MLTMPYFNFLTRLPQLPMLSGFSDFFSTLANKRAKNRLLKAGMNPQIVPTEVLRKNFVEHLLHHNQLTARLPSGEVMTVYVNAYDRINSQLVVPDQTENGLLYLEEGAKVEFYTDLNETHEYFSFISKVNKIKVKGIKLTYYMSIPKVLKKSRRRVLPRVAVKNHSIIRLDGSHFSGTLIDLSVNGISMAIKGYYPEPLIVGDKLSNCNIDIFQPRHNDNISFNCDLSVRRIDFISKPEPTTLIAGIYSNYDKRQEDKILSYLQTN